jgi:dihydrofolate synthase/folylpolyglutamate synthase
LPRPALAVVNVAAAISAVLLGSPLVDQHAISTGIQTAQIAGRFEQRVWHERQLILDVAHNVHGMQFLREQLVAWRQQQTQQGRLHLVFSMLADKDIAGVVAEISGMVDHWHIAPMHVPRAAGLDVLQNVLSNCSYQAYADLPQALTAAVQHTTPHDLIVVCGSFHVLEAVWEVLADDGSKS